MKKYTNKIIIVVFAFILAIIAVLFFIRAEEVKEKIKQYELNQEGGKL